MSLPADPINQHYGATDLGERILSALRRAGKDIDHLTRDDLANLDEFHNSVRGATRALATLGGLGPGMRVLDVGCGVSGPARTLAAEFDCNVVGLDLTQAFCEAAEMLSQRLGVTSLDTQSVGAAGIW